MYSLSRSLLSLSCLASLAIANHCSIPTPACSSPGPQTTYLAEPCFPTTGVRSPTNYYAAQDQGQFNGANGAFDQQLMARCQAACDSSTQCAAFTGEINKAADSDLATGTCFLYSVQQITARVVADAPSMIIAYYKQKVCTATTTATTSSTTTTSTTLSTSTTRSSTTTTTRSTSSTTSRSSSSTSSSTTSSTRSPSTTSTSTSTSTSSRTSTSTTSSRTSTSTTSSRTSTSTTSSRTTASTTSSSTTTASTTTSSSTTSSVAPTPTANTNCQSSTGNADINYAAIFSGSGVTTNPATVSGNTSPAPITTTLSGSLSTCAAIQQCANLADAAPSKYFSFDLHYMISQNQWACVQYYDRLNQGDFNTQNANVGRSFGYSILV